MNLITPHVQRCLMGLTMLMMVALQIQVDLFASETYIGLRINLGDVLVPLGGLCIIISLLTKTSIWPCFQLTRCVYWLAAITLVMSFAAMQPLWSDLEWNQWGLVNKYIGWLVLLSLFLWGAWARTNLPEPVITQGLKIMAGSGVAIMAVSLVGLFLLDHGVSLPLIFDYPVAGFMSNRNSYALFICCLGAIVSVFHLKKVPLLTPAVLMGFWLLMPLAHALIGSRAGWVICPLILIGLVVTGRKAALKPILLPFILGMALLSGLAHSGAVDLSRGYQMRLFGMLPELIKDVRDDAVDFRDKGTRLKYHQQSDAYRIQAAEDAIEVWKSSPITGKGLGSFLQFQNEKYGQFLDLIDNSALWLLSETGALGLLLFSSFYILILLKLKNRQDALAKAMIWTLLIFAAFSVLHEVMYTRFIWFLMGLSLGVPVSERVSSDQRNDTGEIHIERT